MRRILAAFVGLLAAVAWPGQAANAQSAPPDLAELRPLLPPGISDFNLELFGKYACMWTAPDGTHVVEVLGDFVGRMGGYKLSARNAVVWFRNRSWENRPYLDADLFLHDGAELLQPGGTVDAGPVLLVTLRTFGRLVVNSDGRAAQDDSGSDLYREALRARRLLEAAPTEAAEETQHPVQVAATLERLRAAAPRIPRTVDFTAERLFSREYDGETVIVATGDVMISQGSPAESGEYTELRTDAAVLYLDREKVGDNLPGLIGARQRPGRSGRRGPQDTGAPDESRLEPQKKPGQQQFEDWIEAAYLEGDVVLTRGQRMIRASRLYYDFRNDQALILDAVTRAFTPDRQVPIYVRAAEIRQLNTIEYAATRAQITTSEFHTPHVSVGAEKVFLTDRTPRDESGKVVGIEAGRYKAYHTTLNLEGLPIAYWPFSAGDFSRDRMAFRSAKFGYSGDFGASFETRWYLFNVMGLEQPPGYDATLKLDYFTDRGPAAGIDMDYERENYFGLVRSYYINDHGRDELGPERSADPPHDNRGRLTWRHRQIFPKGWELSLEGSYISDRNFLEQYERSEFENAKDQETLAYLVKRTDNWQLSTLANWRINDFQTQTEHLPDTQFTLIGQPLGELATFYSENRAGVVRYKFDRDSTFGLPARRPNAFEDSGSVVRGDTRQELQFPLPDLGPVKLTPYVAGRAGGYDDSPDIQYEGSGGGFGRVFGAYGVHGNVLLSKVIDAVESELLDLHRLRHIIKPDFSLWNAHSNRDPQHLTPFDGGVEDIADFGGGTLGLRQKLQTQRGGPGRWRTVDWITLDVEGGFFTNSQFDENTHGDYIFSRPEDSLSSNFIATNFQYRVSDSTLVVYDGVYDTNEGNMGNSNVSLAVEREPRMAYFVGWRYIHDTNNNLLAFGANYKLSEKHTVAIREMYDVEEGRNYQTELSYIRKWPRWYTAVALDVDRGLDDVGINFSIWPEGAPRIGLGSKRYTGLADSVGIRPQ